MAYEFDGTSTYTVFGNAAETPNNGVNISVSALVYLDSAGSGTRQFICRDYSFTGTDRCYQFRVNSSDQLQFIVFSGGGAATATSTGTIPNDQWAHVAGTFDGTTIRNYINGSADGTQAQSGDADTDDVGIALGFLANNDDGVTAASNFLDGRLAECAEWKDYVLSPSQIERLYKRASPRLIARQSLNWHVRCREDPAHSYVNNVHFSISNFIHAAHPSVNEGGGFVRRHLVVS